MALTRLHAPDVDLQWTPDRKVSASAALAVLLNAFKGVHTLWSLRKPLTIQQIDQYTKHIENMRMAWVAFKWKPTPWIHWVLAHSCAVISEYRTLSLFSSIPTEARHRPFKADLRLCSLSGRHKNPMRAAYGLVRLLNAHAMDKGLSMHAKTLRKRKRTSC